MASAIVKRQRKRRRIDTDGDPEFQVAPMVDVLLVLMLFFMAITSTEVLKKDPALQLADAKHAKKPEKDHKNEIIVNVKWDSKNSVALFSYNQQNYAAAGDLQGILTSAHAQKGPNSYIVIRADKDVQYSNISDLMSVCANAGIATVTFAVLVGGDQAPAAGPGAAASN